MWEIFCERQLKYNFVGPTYGHAIEGELGMKISQWNLVVCKILTLIDHITPWSVALKVNGLRMNLFFSVLIQW